MSFVKQAGRVVGRLAVSEHGIEDVAAAPGEGDQGFVVAFVLGDLVVVVGPGEGSLRAANADRKRARWRTLFPPRGGCSPRIEDPDRRVTGARPA